jgi:hypothetical protein
MIVSLLFVTHFNKAIGNRTGGGLPAAIERSALNI